MLTISQRLPYMLRHADNISTTIKYVSRINNIQSKLPRIDKVAAARKYD
ncbi:hypothetical protein [Staphylococcus microti]|nr:hypothetical protein [Staphylococcus microti]